MESYSSTLTKNIRELPDEERWSDIEIIHFVLDCLDILEYLSENH